MAEEQTKVSWVQQLMGVLLLGAGALWLFGSFPFIGWLGEKAGFGRNTGTLVFLQFTMPVVLPFVAAYLWFELKERVVQPLQQRSLIARLGANEPQALLELVQATRDECKAESGTAYWKLFVERKERLPVETMKRVLEKRAALDELLSHGAGAFNADGWLALSQMEARDRLVAALEALHREMDH